MRFATACKASLFVCALCAWPWAAQAGHAARKRPVAVAPAPKPAAAAPRPAAPAVDLSGLLKAFAQAPGVYAQFVERKQMALLAAPLESSGMLYFAAPGLLARHTLAPEPGVLVVEPNQVRMFDGKHWEVMDLRGKPVVRLFVESFVRILQGDETALRQLYTIDFKNEPGMPSRWLLTLRPKVAPMDKLIDRLDLHGDGLVMDRMRIIEVGGDETTTSFQRVDIARQYTAAEKAKFFFQQGR